MERGRSRGRLAALVSFLSLSACYHHTYTLSDHDPEPTASFERWHDHFLFGSVDADDPIDVNGNCPVGGFRIEDRQTPLNALVAIGTLGIYTPRKEELVCVSPR